MTENAITREAKSVVPEPVAILYTNWRGETAVRRIRIDFIAHGNEALGFGWGSNEWHPEDQMLLSALDVDKGERRTFALSGIKAWGQAAIDAALAAKPDRLRLLLDDALALLEVGDEANTPGTDTYTFITTAKEVLKQQTAALSAPSDTSESAGVAGETVRHG